MQKNTSNIEFNLKENNLIWKFPSICVQSVKCWGNPLGLLCMPKSNNLMWWNEFKKETEIDNKIFIVLK